MSVPDACLLNLTSFSIKSYFITFFENVFFIWEKNSNRDEIMGVFMLTRLKTSTRNLNVILIRGCRRS